MKTAWNCFPYVAILSLSLATVSLAQDAGAKPQAHPQATDHADAGKSADLKMKGVMDSIGGCPTSCPLGKCCCSGACVEPIGNDCSLTCAPKGATHSAVTTSGRYKGKFAEKGANYVLDTPAGSVTIPKKSAQKNPDGTLLVLDAKAAKADAASKAKFQTMIAKEPHDHPDFGFSCYNMCCPSGDCDTTCCLTGGAHVTCDNGKANTSCDAF